MKNKTQIPIFSILAFLCFLLIGFCIGKIDHNDDYNELVKRCNERIITYENKPIPKTEQDIVDDCIGLSLEKTANCMVSNVRSFYKYREVRQSGKIIFDYLKETGGSCVSYSELYKDLSKRMGFYSNTTTIHFKDNSLHMYSIISNNEGYCILDQISYYCFDNFNL
jgi:hypothetical protein